MGDISNYVSGLVMGVITGTAIGIGVGSYVTERDKPEQHQTQHMAVCERYGSVLFVIEDVVSTSVNGEIFTIIGDDGEVLHYRMPWDVMCSDQPMEQSDV